MKYITTLLCVLGLGCSPPDASVSSGSTTYQMGDGNTLEIRTIIIDGNEYLSFKSSDGRWGLCPRLAPKGESVLPPATRPTEPQKGYGSYPTHQTNQ